MMIAGYFLAILVGLSLGLIGSGGSILTVPILVYVMEIEATNATTYSLFIVGVSALVGSLKGIREGLTDYKIAFYFGLPSVLSIFVMRKWVVPFIPDPVLGGMDKDIFLMLVFAILMLGAANAMIRQKTVENSNKKAINMPNLVFRGMIIGILTGLVGVGGGFLIIPTLVFSAQLPMKKAVATSLTIISVNAMIGFLGSLHHTTIDWQLLFIFTFLAIIGIFLGMNWSKKISNEKLKPAFGWFVLLTGIYIIVRELFLDH